MPVLSFECAIAKPQIARYLAGEPLDEESLSQLTAHIAGCDECQRLVDERRRAAALSSSPLREAVGAGTAVVSRASSAPIRPAQTFTATPMIPELASESVSEAPAAPSAPAKSAPHPLMEVVKRLPLPKLYRTVSETNAPESAKSPASKPAVRAIGYGGALIATLGVMSYLGNPTQLLGGKAATANLATKPTASGSVAKSTAANSISAKAIASRPIATVATVAKPTSRTAFGIPLATDAPAGAAVASVAKAPPARTDAAAADDAGPDDTFNVPPASATRPAPAAQPPSATPIKSVSPVALKKTAPQIPVPKVPAPKTAAPKSFGPEIAIKARPVTKAPSIASVAPTASKAAPHPTAAKARRIHRAHRKAKAKAATAGDTIRIYDATAR